MDHGFQGDCTWAGYNLHYGRSSCLGCDGSCLAGARQTAIEEVLSEAGLVGEQRDLFLDTPCPYCVSGYTGLPEGACENCLNTRALFPELLFEGNTSDIKDPTA